jgi:two-component system response regulator MprA
VISLAGPFNGRSVLFIDGDSALRAAVSEALALEGYTVRAVRPGPGALTLLDEAPPGLVVMDPDLPNWGHWTIPAAVRAHAAGIPILALGASAGIRRFAEEVLAEGYLDKPVAVGEFLLAIARMFG